jgi:2-succinyl-5-enolpyruvyl-6-hydroxy-3-cyclohexene-1-carboxylate synthase
MTPPTKLDFRNVNSLWGSVLVETLFRLGLRHVVISPGSRSTPLTMAFARHPGIEALPVLDERSAAFLALGLAKGQRRPVALLCTSGTAGANYFPAVIEAQESGVPLLVLTADRPPELRACRSGQTIDQQKLFGLHVNFHHELAVPAVDFGLFRYLRQTVAHAWGRTQWPVAGPVHLNAPFRDPLPPIPDASTASLRAQFKGEAFFRGLRVERGGEPNPAAANTVFRALRAMRSRRGIIVAGPAQPADPAAYARAVARISRHLGWPVLADALSGLRDQARLVPNLVTTYDLIARSDRLTKGLQPAHVLCLNEWPTSKTLRQWLQGVDAEVTFVSPQLQNPDALHNRTTWVHASAIDLAARPLPAARSGAWRQSWLKVDQSLRRRLAGELHAVNWPFEGRASALLPRVLPEGTPVLVANSMPVRDAEYFWPPGNRGHRIQCNRGANGIDGTLSTALGLAHASPQPAVLLTGDLALLHDTNGFLVAAQCRGSLTVVLINNAGGGIFEHLPIAQFNPAFEKFFATPQRADFAKLCRAYGVRHVRVRDWTHLAGLVAKLPVRGLRVLEVRTDRRRDAAFRQELFARLAARL